MIIPLLLYFLFAITFILAKKALFFIPPLFFIAFRMILAGVLLLLFLKLRKKHISFNKIGYFSIFLLSLIHIFIPYSLEFWALQYMTAAKTCLIYNLSPFITAFLLYSLHDKGMNFKQLAALFLGFFAYIPLFWSIIPQEGANIISLPESLLLLSVLSSCYGWLFIKNISEQKNISYIQLNAYAMLIGGLCSLILSLSLEYKKIITISLVDIGYGAFYGLLLIIIANFICYNLYGYLLTRYSPTFISLVGQTTPLWTAILGWVFLSENISFDFLITFFFVSLSLLLFYKEENSLKKDTGSFE